MVALECESGRCPSDSLLSRPRREVSDGSYTVIWNGADASGKSVATGVYLYRFQAGDHLETKKMLLLK